MLPFVSPIPQEHIELTDIIRSSEERLKFVLCQQFFGRRVTRRKDSYYTYIRETFMTFLIWNLCSSSKVPFLCNTFLPDPITVLLNLTPFSQNSSGSHSSFPLSMCQIPKTLEREVKKGKRQRRKSLIREHGCSSFTASLTTSN